MPSVSTLVTYYNTVMSLGDERVNNWFLVQNHVPMSIITAVYLYFVKVGGPAWMEKRKPFQINKIILFYNFLMVCLSSFFFIYGTNLTYLGKYSLWCQAPTSSTDPEVMRILRLEWWYMVMKILELSDTVFFVLRKKYEQISNLHVVHHVTVLWTVWICFKYSPDGQNVFFALVNCFVHAVMYSYYFLAALGPTVRKYLWWKKYLTQLQMAQFVICFLHACIPLFYDCGFKSVFAFILIFDGVLFLLMFRNFYRKSYDKKQNASASISRCANGFSRVQKNNEADEVDLKIGELKLEKHEENEKKYL